MDALRQRIEQWPRVGEQAGANRRPPFGGYAPGTHAYEPGQLIRHEDGRKMAAAALFDHQRQQWNDFD